MKRTIRRQPQPPIWRAARCGSPIVLTVLGMARQPCSSTARHWLLPARPTLAAPGYRGAYGGGAGAADCWQERIARLSRIIDRRTGYWAARSACNSRGRSRHQEQPVVGQRHLTWRWHLAPPSGHMRYRMLGRRRRCAMIYAARSSVTSAVRGALRAPLQCRAPRPRKPSAAPARCLMAARDLAPPRSGSPSRELRAAKRVLGRV
jgi:hypothetical protein